MTFTSYLPGSLDLLPWPWQCNAREPGDPQAVWLLLLPTDASTWRDTAWLPRHLVHRSLACSAATGPKARASVATFNPAVCSSSRADWLVEAFPSATGADYPQRHFLWASSAGKKGNIAGLTLPSLQTSHHAKENTRSLQFLTSLPWGWPRWFLQHLFLCGNVDAGFWRDPKSRFQYHCEPAGLFLTFQASLKLTSRFSLLWGVFFACWLEHWPKVSQTASPCSQRAHGRLAQAVIAEKPNTSIDQEAISSLTSLISHFISALEAVFPF